MKKLLEPALGLALVALWSWVSVVADAKLATQEAAPARALSVAVASGPGQPASAGQSAATVIQRR